MNKSEKVRLLNRIAKGDLHALREINPRLSVFCFDIIGYDPFWIDHKYLADLYRVNEEEPDEAFDERVKAIWADTTIRKYNNAELLEMSKTRFVFAIPPDLLFGNVRETVDLLNGHHEQQREREAAKKTK